MVKLGRFFEKFYMGIILAVMYLPILVLVVLSFNNSKSSVKWGGFTLKWYVSMFHNSAIVSAIETTIVLAIGSALIAVIIGTVAALGINAMRKKGTAIFLGATNIPLLNADIVTGISMMLLFVRFMNLGFSSVLIAHITFNIPYVILSVLPKLKQVNKNTYEAALDLGASPIYAFFKIIWPDILPGVLTGFLMAMTMSLDDFTITYFTKGAGVNTLSTMIYTKLKRGINPELYAVSTLMFVTVILLLIIVNLRSGRKEQPAKIIKKAR